MSKGKAYGGVIANCNLYTDACDFEGVELTDCMLGEGGQPATGVKTRGPESLVAGVVFCDINVDNRRGGLVTYCLFEHAGLLGPQVSLGDIREVKGEEEGRDAAAGDL